MEACPVDVARGTTANKPNPWGVPVPAQGQTNTGSPWGKPSHSPAPCSLNDVMSEELAKELQSKEEGKSSTHQPKLPAQSLSDEIDPEVLQFLANEGDGHTLDDEMLAQLLQHEFDKEHDAMLAKEQNKLNGTSKVTLSFDNYRTVHPGLQEASESESDEDWDGEPEKDEPVPAFNKAGIAVKGKKIITKHDAGINSRANATKVMETFPPEFDTGDDRSFKMRLPNNVYNQLKVHSIAENKRGARLHEKKEHSTAEHAVDPKTRLILYKLVNNEILEEVNGVISTGKESVVFHARGGSMSEFIVPAECALKVFKTSLNEFKNRSEYVKGDFRLCRDTYKKQNPRKIMKLWAEKEHLNLKCMAKAGIPCPQPVVLKKHVLVMSFIGEDQKPAPKLKEAQLSMAELELAYEQCIENIKKLYQVCGLVHADLSEYNILWHNDTAYIIDVSQAVEKMHPKSQEFLLRDCHNICKFFNVAGVADVISEYQLFNDITGLNLKGTGREFLAQIEEYEKNMEKLTTGDTKDYPFDYFFQLAQEERLRKDAEAEPAPSSSSSSSH